MKTDVETDIDDVEELINVPVKERRLITQPYDNSVSSLIEAVSSKRLYLKPLHDRPHFQRNYVWDKKFASRLIESIILNVPIPPVYLSENEENELDVIDGQQRIYSIYMYVKNQFQLKGLEVYWNYNGLRFHELPAIHQRSILNYSIRSVVITNQSHPEIKFDVFERLNTNTRPLNSQELRNCMYRGNLNDLLHELVLHKPWLDIQDTKEPQGRMQDAEMILRFFAFHIGGVKNYKTPLKIWLNHTLKDGKHYDPKKIAKLKNAWEESIDKILLVFKPEEAFRRPDEKTGKYSRTLNKSIMDLQLYYFSKKSVDFLKQNKKEIRRAFQAILEDDAFKDLLTKSVDHKSRTEARFKKWDEFFGHLG
ncbi:DUF262 domain-containing protein [Micavibrio aeruginosavorus]|uniref:GmrSD restriction endonucleases N-terminal domain-containing protein n=1 Tax=Micavibrio aeruginosavorus (strain ARL-13) TaxID=856793 RepID=G2KRK5_MICAA|nr:DUF262 domain-containing protein [Micavibrio aeruginosavorus]AEP09567.1 conserved hypothetical protein [Micavibrio aeruginosavorus ARL-13]